MTIAADAARRHERAGPDLAGRLGRGAGRRAGAVPAARQRCPGRSNYPADAVVPVADWVSAIMSWLKINLTWLTRSITAILGVPLDFALDLLAKNFKIGHGAGGDRRCRACPGSASAPRRSSPAAPSAAGGSALLVGGCFLYIALFGKWTSAMLTLGADLDRRAVLHRHRPAPRHLGVAQAMGRTAHRLAGARPDADDPDLRLSHPDAAAVRQQPGLGDDRHRHLRHAADGARHHARPVARAGRDRRIRRDGRLHARARSCGACCCPRRGRR